MLQSTQQFDICLRAKTQILERLQCVSVVDSTTHAQKDGCVESNGGSLKVGAEAFVCSWRVAISWF